MIALGVLPGPTLAEPWNTLITVGEVLVALGVIWRAIPATWRHVLVPVSNAIKRVDDVTEATPALLEIAKIAPIIEEMAKQFKPNGGTSFVDRLTQLEAALQESALATNIQLRQNTEAIKDHTERLEDVERTIARL